MKLAFHKGDRVVCVVDSPGGNKMLRAGHSGTIIASAESVGKYGVKWDSNINGHTLSGRCESGYGWWVSGESISLDEKELYIATEEELRLFLLS